VNMRNALAALTCLMFLSACSPPTPREQDTATTELPEQQSTKAPQKQAKAQRPNLNKLYQQAAQELFSRRAVSATLYGLNEEQVGAHFQDKLEDYSPQAEAELRAKMRELKKQLTELASLSAQDDENAAVVLDILDYYSGQPKQPVGYIDVWMGHSPFVVNQINGPMIDVPNNLLNSHNIASVNDAHDYIARLNAFMDMAKSVVAKLEYDAARNWIPPRVLVEKTISYLEKYPATGVEQAPLYQKLELALSQLKLPNEQADELRNQAKKALSKSVFPAFALVRESLQKLLPRARLEAGIWAQPGGEAFYQYSVRKLGDTELSPEQIHTLGLQEVERINNEMEPLLQALGYTEGTPGERMALMAKEDKYLYPNNDEGRAQLLADLNTYVGQIRQRMPDLFGEKPKYEVEIRRIPVATEDSSAGGYYTSPAMDGSVPGIYWINLKDTHTNPKFGLKTLTYHEAIPGHHWQIALNMGQHDLPLLRRVASYNAYIEGWALYAELVAKEMGMYEKDPAGDLGRLQAELYRAVRLVVDTGLHYKKWTREQAIDYMTKTTGSPEADVVSEIERYMAWPGQALGYKLGMLKILELRELARQKLGVKFDPRDFHDLILKGGAVPMAILKQKVNDWIDNELQTQKAKSKQQNNQ